MPEMPPAPERKRAPVRDSIGLPFTIFRGRDALDYDEAGIMHQASPASQPSTAANASASEPSTSQAALADAIAQAMDNGALAATRTRLLFARPGMSLSYAWFKSGFPLPRHSHDADCLYFILAGSLRLGTEDLGPGDGFFVGKDVPYAYVPGANGVEVLEFRTADAFDIKLLAGNPAWWGKALDRILERRESWRDETLPPSGLELG